MDDASGETNVIDAKRVRSSHFLPSEKFNGIVGSSSPFHPTTPVSRFVWGNGGRASCSFLLPLELSLDRTLEMLYVEGVRDTFGRMEVGLIGDAAVDSVYKLLQPKP